MEAQSPTPDTSAKPDGPGPAEPEVPRFDVNQDRAKRANHQANFFHERVEDVISIIIEGDVIGRDKIDGPVRRMSVRPMPAKTLQRYLRFAAPSSMDEVRALLATRKVVVLAAERGWGKYAFGVNLLNELSGNPHVVEDCETNLLTTAHRFEAGKGYVLGDVPWQRLLELSRDDVEALVSTVEQASALLVITAQLDPVAPLTNFEELVPELGQPAPLEAVLSSHLRPASTRERAKELLADTRVADRLRTCDSRGEVCGLAAELTGSAPASALNSLSSQEKRQLRTDVEAWLRSLADAHWPYAFATAVLDGMPADVALRGGAELSRTCRLEALDAVRRMQLLRDIRVRTAPESWYTTYGEVPVEIVRCEQQRHRPLVVELVWRHGAQLRGPMLRWMRRMGEHDDLQVAIAAGAAVGQLALRDFVAVRQEVIEPWVVADDFGPREAAVAALSILASDDRFVPVLSKLALRWWTGSPAEQWTAVRAYGRPLGALAWRTAFACFKSSCLKRDNELLTAVADSVVELAIDGSDTQLAALLDVLADWSGDERPTLRRAAVFVFLRLTVDVTDATTALPRLLRPGDGKTAAVVARLWERAIVDPDLHEVAASAARLWARLCESHSDGPDLLAALFGQVGRSTRERRLVQLLSSSWNEIKNYPTSPRCAQAVARAVSRSEEREAG